MFSKGDSRYIDAMRYLLTNDDGIDAPGLAALEQTLYLTVGEETTKVSTVAPHEGYSGCGHLVNYREALRVHSFTDSRHMVVGAPADCTRIGVSQLAPETECVLAGINLGANLGVDVWMSGTVSAVREAGWMGVPGIAISQYFREDLAVDWEWSARAASRVLQEILSRGLGQSFWNVNLPAVKTSPQDLEIVDTFVEPQHLPIAYTRQPDGGYRYTGDYRSRPRTTGSDVDVCFGGGISMTEIAWPGKP